MQKNYFQMVQMSVNNTDMYSEVNGRPTFVLI